jgi:hypothetical protein
MRKLRQEALETGIDDYVVRRALGMANTMSDYAPLVGSASMRVVKYEEFIFRKADLIRVIAERFGWGINDHVVAEILSWAEVKSDVEDPKEFVRKVTPGDHREKLAADTIARLNEALRPAIELFHY